MHLLRLIVASLTFVVSTANAIELGTGSNSVGDPAITHVGSILAFPLLQSSAGELLIAPKGTLDGRAGTTLDITKYLPLKAGNQWNYVNGSYATQTTTIGSAVTLPGGIVAIPTTTVQSNEAGTTSVYFTNDSNGIRRHLEFASSVYISGYGTTSVTGTYSPPLTIAPATVTLGSTYTSSGAVTLDYAGIGPATLNYSASTQIVGFETVTDYQGARSWSAVKVVTSITLSGTINGQFLTNSSASTTWFAEGMGPVRTMNPNASGAMETWKLSSTNVTPPPVISAPAAPTGVTATAGNGQATVSFTPPTDNGGSAITSYSVVSSPAGGIDSGAGTTATTRTISGLTNGVAYTFSVTATNAAGTSAYSTASNRVTPAAPQPLTNFNFQGLWWNAPAGSEAGWGINFTHQGDIIFATWFTYDASGKPWWLIAELHKAAASVYSGSVATVTGVPFNSAPWDISRIVETTVGVMTVTFNTANDATLFYTVNGITQTKSITKQIFGPLPVCTAQQ